MYSPSACSTLGRTALPTTKCTLHCTSVEIVALHGEFKRNLTENSRVIGAAGSVSPHFQPGYRLLHFLRINETEFKLQAARLASSIVSGVGPAVD